MMKKKNAAMCTLTMCTLTGVYRNGICCGVNSDCNITKGSFLFKKVKDGLFTFLTSSPTG